MASMEKINRPLNKKASRKQKACASDEFGKRHASGLRLAG